MSWRDKPRPERMSKRLRRETEKPWKEDRYLSSAGGGGCDWDGGHHHDTDAAANWNDDQDDGGEEFV
jgi:hypothetical protein